MDIVESFPTVAGQKADEPARETCLLPMAFRLLLCDLSVDRLLGLV